MKIVGDLTCEVTNHHNYKCGKGLIYIYDSEISDVNEFEMGLKENFNISSVEYAHFIKTKNDQTKVFILHFRQETLPRSIYIPGEKADTIIYPFDNRPMMCRNCQQYGHTAKRCHNTICRRCSYATHTDQNVMLLHPTVPIARDSTSQVTRIVLYKNGK